MSLESGIVHPTVTHWATFDSMVCHLRSFDVWMRCRANITRLTAACSRASDACERCAAALTKAADTFAASASSTASQTSARPGRSMQDGVKSALQRDCAKVAFVRLAQAQVMHPFAFCISCSISCQYMCRVLKTFPQATT